MEKFKGVLFHVGVPSVMAPCGTKEHRILISPELAEDALEQLLGKPIYLASSPKKHWIKNEGYTRHSREEQDIIGYITKTEIISSMFCVFGNIVPTSRYIRLQASSEVLGLSFDADDCIVADTCSPIWTIKDAIFLGANVLPQSECAHRTNCEFKFVF